jgi:hypothetical protein
LNQLLRAMAVMPYSGTSMSAPHVAGAAHLQEDPTSPRELTDGMRVDATAGIATSERVGSPNCCLTLKLS